MSPLADRLSPANLAFVESLYEEFLRDPNSVPLQWRERFNSLPRGERPSPRWRRRPSFDAASLFGGGNGVRRAARAAGRPAEETVVLQDRVDQLLRAYRSRGHMIAAIDPLGLTRPSPMELDPSYYRLTERDLDRRFSSDTIPGAKVRSLREIVAHLRETYCRSIGVQYMHMDDLEARWWLRERMEATANRIELEREEQVRILTRLTDAVVFEEFIQKKYTGAKSFSLEGAESLIPLLDLAIERAGEHGVEEIVLGMAHRGRLNVLANVVGKSPQQIFREFEDADPELYLGRGDVKYHLGHTSDWVAATGRTIRLSLCFNPSHLEFVNPVALGRVRAKQDRIADRDGARVMALLIHGDASFAGEGVVQETLNLSELEGYRTGGTVHVIVNNQIGFTTTPREGRSSNYASAVAKILQIPIFHVNGEDPEAVAQVVHLAMDFRKEFRRDVVIDMYCYRRRGHNETDEPSFTQPALYKAIEARSSVRDGYLEHLLELGGVTREEADAIETERRDRLEQALHAVRQEDGGRPAEIEEGWSGFCGGPEADDEVDTGVEASRLAGILQRQTEIPDGFRRHPKLERLVERRREMARGERGLDWAAAEALAFGSLAVGGHRVRLSGQDCARGTFNQRHAVLHDHEDGHAYRTLQHLDPGQASVELHNSPLSEAGVLGFEYGYSIDCPDGLVAWEAQFGDFVNAAQVIIDQFITSAEDKWRQLSGIVLLLPHGFEGLGPEHSSARLERFLTLAAEHNIQVVQPTTPVQYFHVLRRQVRRRWRKPLVVLTPKSLLRDARAVSSLEECSTGRFRRILPDVSGEKEGSVERILLCSGKIYYALAEARETKERSNVALLRAEELYPFPAGELEDSLARYRRGTPVVWVQEEPENMGAWYFVQRTLGELLDGRYPVSGVYRPESASPATGSRASHQLEEKRLVAEAFGDEREAKGVEEEARRLGEKVRRSPERDPACRSS